MDIRVGAATNVGRVREHNEDSFCVNRKHHIFIVADGMGGHAAGEIASNQLKDHIEEYLLRDDRPDSIHTCLTEGVQAANHAIYQMGIEDQKKRGMGTTATILTVSKDRYFIAQVGDSRAYRLRNGQFEQLTRDHSRVFQLYESGLITKEEMEDHPLSNVITRSIGNHSTVDPDIYDGELAVGDRYLLCTDGLTGEVRERDIFAILEAHKDPQEAVDVLIESALANGGKDNITAVVLDFKAGEDARRKTVPMTLEELKGLPPPPGAKDRTDKPAPEVTAEDAAAARQRAEAAQPPAKAEASTAPPPTSQPTRRPDPEPSPRSDPPLPEPSPRGGGSPKESGSAGWAAIALVAAAIVLVGWWATRGSGGPSLQLDSIPPGAEVYLDGTFVGETPLKIEPITPGKHSLRLTKGDRTRTVEVEVGATGPHEQNVVLDTRAVTP